MHVPAALARREIVKRDGTRVPFEAERIKDAIARAGQATGEFPPEAARQLTEQVLKVVLHRAWSSSPSVEDI